MVKISYEVEQRERDTWSIFFYIVMEKMKYSQNTTDLNEAYVYDLEFRSMRTREQFSRREENRKD